MGHLRPGTTRSQASAQIAVLSAQLRRDRAIDNVAQELAVVPTWRSPFGAQTYMLPAVIVLSAMGALLLPDCLRQHHRPRRVGTGRRRR